MTNQEFIESITLEGEEWRDVVGYEGYYMVSSFGRVISLKRDKYLYKNYNPKPAMILKLQQRKNGYIGVYLHKEGKIKFADVHREVAKAFIPNPNNYPCIDHINTIKQDNNVDNLRWCTYAQNMNNPITRRKITRDLSVVGVRTDGSMVIYASMQEAKKDGYNQAMISECCNHNRKHHKGLQWFKYSDYETQSVMSKNS